MVLAWEYRLSPLQRKNLQTIYQTVHLEKPNAIHNKMLELIANTKAAGTMSAYTSIIRKWKTFCRSRGCPDMPASKDDLASFIASLALDEEPLSTFLKLVPALKMHHDCHALSQPSVAESPFIKLLIDGAAREAAARKPPTKKADSLDKEQIHQLIQAVLWKKGVGVYDPDSNLTDWRTTVRLFSYYKTFCR